MTNFKVGDNVFQINLQEFKLYNCDETRLWIQHESGEAMTINYEEFEEFIKKLYMQEF